MKRLIILFLMGLLVSCTENHTKMETSAKPEINIDSTSAITSKDTKIQIRAKLELGAKLDKQEFGESILYDEYFKSNITKYYMKDFGDDQRNLTAVVFEDRLRYMKMLIQHVGDTSTENKAKHFKRIKGGLEKAIESGLYTIVEKNYLKLSENGDIWYNVFVVSESKKTGTQDYWNLMVPESDYNYLKYMVNAFKHIDGFETKFVLSN